jgi:hypothetical protein
LPSIISDQFTSLQRVFVRSCLINQSFCQSWKLHSR